MATYVQLFTKKLYNQDVLYMVGQGITLKSSRKKMYQSMKMFIGTFWYHKGGFWYQKKMEPIG